MSEAKEWRKSIKEGFTASPYSEGPGFFMKFENGFMVSVQWGSFNYGDHYMDTYKSIEEMDYSLLAEIAVINPEGDHMRIDDVDDTIAAYIRAEEVAEYMYKVSKLKNDPVTGKVIDPTNLFTKQ